MNASRRIIAALAVVVLASAADPAAAESPMWVSVGGDDMAPCTRDLPCKTFTGVMSKVMVYAEIRCLDSGDFGPLNMTQAVMVDCRSAPAIIGGFPGVPVIINPPTAYGFITVGVRGLVIIGNDVGPGIRVLAGPNVIIDEVTVRHQGTNGIEIVNTAPYITVSITKSVLSENAQHGVLVAPGPGNTAYLDMSNTTSSGNGSTGIRVNDNGVAVVSDSHLTYNGTHGGTAASASAPARLSLERVVTSFNLNGGVLSNGAQATVFLSQVTAIGNSYALYPSSGAYRSFGNNRDDGNQQPGAMATPVTQF